MSFHLLRIRKSSAKPRRIIIAIALSIIIIAVGCAIYATLSKSNFANLQQATFDDDKVSVQPISQRDIDNYKVQSNYPRMLTISSLGVNARMAPLGLLAPQNGTQQLDVPRNVYDTGWYDCTINPVAAKRCATKKLPGDQNIATASLIDGHSCEGYNVPCVFNKLSRIQVSATITVELGDGEKLNYTVKEVDVVPLAQVDMAKMMRPIESGRDGLNLITCAGNWTAKDSRGHNSMDQRVEVYAVR